MKINKNMGYKRCSRAAYPSCKEMNERYLEDIEKDVSSGSGSIQLHGTILVAEYIPEWSSEPGSVLVENSLGETPGYTLGIRY